MKFWVISVCTRVTCRSRQMIESLGEAGVGSILTSVAVGCGEDVAGVLGVSPDEAQAVKINNAIRGIADIFFMVNI